MESPVQQAQTVLVEAQEKIAKLLKLALEQRDFEGLGKLASIARVLDKIATNANTHTIDAAVLSLPTSKNSSTGAHAATRQRPRTEPSAYPHFRRSGNDLIKVGRGRTGAYEHRAGTWVRESAINAIADVATKKKKFRVDDILKIMDARSAPIYQLYAVLAWLKSVKLIAQYGRAVYSVPSPNQFHESVREAWEKLQTAA
jgi:hypothetical protein